MLYYYLIEPIKFLHPSCFIIIVVSFQIEFTMTLDKDEKGTAVESASEGIVTCRYSNNDVSFIVAKLYNITLGLYFTAATK